METLRYETSDEIATITLDRPDKMNAYTAEMGIEIVEAMRRADEDREIRVIILTGAGAPFVPAQISACSRAISRLANPAVASDPRNGAKG